jgi:hypothetical protein
MGSYTRGGTITYQDLAPIVEPFKINDAQYFAFLVDDLDKAQNDLEAMDIYLKRAVVAVNDMVDIKILTKASAGVRTNNQITLTGTGSGATATVVVSNGATGIYTVTAAGTAYTTAPLVVLTGGGGLGATATAVLGSGGTAGTVISITNTNAGQGYTSAPTVTLVAANPITLDSTAGASGVYTQFVKARTLLTKANVPTSGRWAVIDPDTTALLLNDTVHFVRSTSFGDQVVIDGMLGIRTSDGVTTPGLVGRCAGFDVYESNHLVQSTVNAVPAKQLLFGNNDLCSYAAQISNMEMLRLQTTFADAARGLLLHDAIVFAESAKRGVTCLAAA